MSSLVYFGNPSRSSQLVSEELRLRGIDLVRAAPGEMTLVGSRSFDHPSYQHYLNYFHKVVESVITGSPSPFTHETSFYPLRHTEVPQCVKDPSIIWSYGSNITPELLDNVKSRFNAFETTAGGRPALGGVLSPLQMKNLIQDSHPVETTAFSLNSLNIQSYKVYRKLWSLVDVFFRIHQYPLTPHDSTAAKNEYAKFVRFESDAMDTVGGQVRENHDRK
jgi:hypothetical protein